MKPASEVAWEVVDDLAINSRCREDTATILTEAIEAARAEGEAKGRREALKEAAKVADNHGTVIGPMIGDAIRALAEREVG